MRIAISGSHSLGKSTVVNDWVAAHPEFRREEEPYRALALNGPYEILFREASTRLHNGIQMYYNISRLYRYSSPADDVILIVLQWITLPIRNIQPTKAARTLIRPLWPPWCLP